jgi:hypothetical protein
MTRTSEPSPQELGWEPLCSSKTYPSEGGTRLTGDLRNKFTELTLLDAASFDREGPIWISDYEDAPGFHAVAVLYSDAWGRTSGTFTATRRGSHRSGLNCCIALWGDKPRGTPRIVQTYCARGHARTDCARSTGRPGDACAR